MSTYLESEEVTAAKKKAEAHEKNRPEYVSRWESALAQTSQALANRKFQYDLSSDPLWKSYRRAYTRQGRLAMADTLGKTTALTGGYGNSWAASAAQDSYNGYLRQLTDKIPELYDLAQSRYDRETAQLQAQYESYLAQEKQDQENFDDVFDRWLRELEMLHNQQQALEKQDYDRYTDQREWEAKHPASSGSGSGSGQQTQQPEPAYNNGSVKPEHIKRIQAALGVTVDGKWGKESYEAAGHVDADTAWANYLSEFGPLS